MISGKVASSLLHFQRSLLGRGEVISLIWSFTWLGCALSSELDRLNSWNGP